MFIKHVTLLPSTQTAPIPSNEVNRFSDDSILNHTQAVAVVFQSTSIVQLPVVRTLFGC